MEKPVAIRIFRPFPTEAEFLLAESPTITRSTVLLVGAQVRPTGVILRFEIVLQGGSVLLRGEGRVVSHRKDATPTEPAGLLLKFTKLDPKSKALVDRINGVAGAPTSGPKLPAPASGDPALDASGPPSLPSIASERMSLAPLSAAGGQLAANPEAASPPKLPSLHPSAAPPMLEGSASVAPVSVARVPAVAIPPSAYEAPEAPTHQQTLRHSAAEDMHTAAVQQALVASERPTSIPPSNPQHSAAPHTNVHNTYVSGMRAVSMAPSSRPPSAAPVNVNPTSVRAAPHSVSMPVVTLSSESEALSDVHVLSAAAVPAPHSEVQAPPDRDALLKRLRERGRNLSKDSVNELLARAARS